MPTDPIDYSAPLQKVLRWWDVCVAVIATWSSLCCTVSRPFAKPETGKIAVKVINTVVRLPRFARNDEPVVQID